MRRIEKNRQETLIGRASFSVGTDKMELTAIARPAQAKRTVSLEPTPAGAMTISLASEGPGWSGGWAEYATQAAERGGFEIDGALAELIALDRDRSALPNDMNAGTTAQNEIVAREVSRKDSDHYEASRKALDAAGLRIDRGYEYGTAWLYSPGREGVADDLAKLLGMIDGQIFGGEFVDLDDLPSLDGEEQFDTRDVSTRLEGLKGWLTFHGVDVSDLDTAQAEEGAEDEQEVWDVVEEAKMLQDFADTYAEAINNGEPVVLDSAFEDYAEQFASDVGLINDDAKWPNNHIDWKAAANELKGDFSEVTLYGKTYWVRN